MSHPGFLPVSLKKKALIIEDEEFTREALNRELTKLGFEVRCASCLKETQSIFAENKPFDLILSDIHLPDGNVLNYLSSLSNSSSEVTKSGPWIFITGDSSPDLLQKVIESGGFDLLRKPFSRSDLRGLLERITSREKDPVRDIMDFMEGISGIRLGDPKKMLVEGRLHQRARELGLSRLDEYFEYFRAHRHEEVAELVSLVSTHTTEFFREADHFEFLVKQALPTLLQAGRPLRIWSAACSSGEEVYTLAMVTHSQFLAPGQVNKYMSVHGLKPQIDILGTDLDPRSIQKAINGVYPALALQKIPAPLAKTYTDRGTGDLAHWIRIKNDLHQICRFRSANLLSPEWPVKAADIIFLRNALMYFPPDLALKVVERVRDLLPPEGYLFLGHSEAGLGIKANLELVAPAVYRKKR
jgi:chemotaxis protein methyltransferase CheR